MRSPHHPAGKISVWSTVLVTLVVLIAITMVIGLFGGVSGEEFSPQRFTMRRFHYFQVPWTGIQVWPISFRRMRGEDDELAQHVRSQRWVGDVAAAPARWDIMTMNKVGRASVRGDASILTNYLRQPGAAGTASWLDWSKQTPEIARRLWPLVARLAHERLYALIPDVMEAARRAASAEQFQNSVRQLLTQDLRLLAAAEEQVGHAKRAQKCLALAAELEQTELPEGPAPLPAAEADPEDA